MRKNLLHGIAVVTVLVAFLATDSVLSAQDLHPSRRPSPLGIARVNLDDCYVSVVYSRPYKRRRDNIFGGEGSLVPYGQLWRTGANEATQLTSTCNLEVGDQKVPAGTYSLFTTPGAQSWKLHFNSALGLWGTDGYDAANDVAVVSAVAGTLGEEVDQFTIALEAQEEGGGAHLVFSWITTEVRVPVKPAG